jgi:hypothetical protein
MNKRKNLPYWQREGAKVWHIRFGDGIIVAPKGTKADYSPVDIGVDGVMLHILFDRDPVVVPIMNYKKMELFEDNPRWVLAENCDPLDRENHD